MKITIVLCCLLLVTGLSAVDTPTDVEWTPVKEAIDRNDPQARQKLADLLVGRRWSDGWVQLAELDRRAGDYEALATNAKRALQYAYNDITELQRGIRNRPAYELLTANAAYLAILGANRTEQALEGIEIFQQFAQRADPLGLVHLHAAESHLLAAAMRYGDERITTIRTGKDILERGKRMAPSLTPEFFLVEARLLLAEAAYLADLGRAGDARSNQRAAATSYERAIDLGMDNRDMRFSTGRIWHALARSSTRDSERNNFLDSAIEHLQAAATAGGDNDPESYLALGMACLERGRHGDAHTALTAALNGFDDSTPAARRAEVHHARGRAAMELTNNNPDTWPHSRALEDLLAARDLGEDIPALYNNLLVTTIGALGATRDPDERQRLQTIIDQTRPLVSEDATRVQAKALYESAKTRFAEAATPALLQELNNAVTLFAADLNIIPTESDDWHSATAAGDQDLAPVWRFLGLSLHLQAEIATTLATADDAPADLPGHDTITQWRDQAAMAWRIAGNMGDHLARRHFLVRESRRDPHHAYHSGWVALSWSRYLSPSSWAVVIGNYGATERWREPLHIAIWATLAGICLLLGIKGFFFAKKPDREPGRTLRRERPAPRPSKEASVGDGTLMPDNVPQPNTDALERRRADQSKRSSKKPAAPAKPDPRRRAIDDVARRLADQPGNRQSPPPRRRR